MNDEEEFERFLIEMMKYNNSNSYYEIDDDLFDMCVFDDDGNLLDINFGALIPFLISSLLTAS